MNLAVLRKMRPFTTLFSIVSTFFVLTQYEGFCEEHEKSLLNLNLQINRLNFSRFHNANKKHPLFFNFDLPNLFRMNWDTKRHEKEGTSLGFRVLQPITRFLRMFETPPHQERDADGWSLRRRHSKEELPTDFTSRDYIRERAEKYPTDPENWSAYTEDQETTPPSTTPTQQEQKSTELYQVSSTTPSSNISETSTALPTTQSLPISTETITTEQIP